MDAPKQSDMQEDYDQLIKELKAFKPGAGFSKSAACFKYAEKYGLTYKGNCIKTNRPLFAEKK